MHLQCLVFQPRCSVERCSGVAISVLRALAASNRDDRLGLTHDLRCAGLKGLLYRFCGTASFTLPTTPR